MLVCAGANHEPMTAAITITGLLCFSIDLLLTHCLSLTGSNPGAASTTAASAVTLLALLAVSLALKRL